MLPFWVTDSLSPITVLYAGLLTLVAAGIVGVLPALRVTRLSVLDSLRREQAASANLRFGGMWTTAIVVQVAITVALLPLAAVLVIASNRWGQRAEGVGADRYLSATVAFERQEQEAESAAVVASRRRSVTELERRLRAEPGVEQVAFADRLPVADTSKYRRRSRHRRRRAGDAAAGQHARARVVRLLCGVWERGRRRPELLAAG